MLEKPTKNELTQLYINKEMSMREIAISLGCSTSGICKWLKEYGIPTRPPGTNGHKAYTIQEAKKVFADNGHTLIAEEYIGSAHPMPYKCRCGNESKMSLDCARQGKACKKCGHVRAGLKGRLSEKEVRYLFVSKGCTPLFESYTSNQEPLDCICHCGARAKISVLNLKNGRGCWNCRKIKLSGENHYKWNPNLTDEDREGSRLNDEYYEVWRTQVLRKDNYTCQICKRSSGMNLHAHHLDGYAEHKEKRMVVENGVCLCVECHFDFHNNYGRGNNTKEQFEEFSNYKGVICNGSSEL